MVAAISSAPDPLFECFHHPVKKDNVSLPGVAPLHSTNASTKKLLEEMRRPCVLSPARKNTRLLVAEVTYTCNDHGHPGGISHLQ